ncbi:hypothetical protein OAU50_02785 [Planctomycetota bacterium]|nr:hypothetical protein [Planctomycetota bacterium]
MKLSRPQLIRIARAAGIAIAEVVEKVEAGEKRCSGCVQWLTESSYNKKTGAYDGLQNYCKVCQAKKNNKNKWTSLDVEVIRKS